VLKALLVGIVAVLAVPALAVAKPPPSVLCGPQCDSGGGWTGCAQLTVSHTGGVPYLATVRHYLVVSYCKRAGTITSVSIAAHGCDTGGLISCKTGPAWQTGGGVGSSLASFEAHATWIVTTMPLYTNSDILMLTVPVG
jgi:hypothetical protein